MFYDIYIIICFEILIIILYESRTVPEWSILNIYIEVSCVLVFRQLHTNTSTLYTYFYIVYYNIVLILLST